MHQKIPRLKSHYSLQSGFLIPVKKTLSLRVMSRWINWLLLLKNTEVRGFCKEERDTSEVRSVTEPAL